MQIRSLTRPYYYISLLFLKKKILFVRYLQQFVKQCWSRFHSSCIWLCLNSDSSETLMKRAYMFASKPKLCFGLDFTFPQIEADEFFSIYVSLGYLEIAFLQRHSLFTVRLKSAHWMLWKNNLLVWWSHMSPNWTLSISLFFLFPFLTR